MRAAAGRRDRPISRPGARDLERHPERPHDALGRNVSGAVGVFRHPAGYTNGNTVDRQGRLVSCEHGGRRVTRTEHDGSVIADRRPLRRQAAQQPERRGRANRTIRSGSPIRPTASTPTTRGTRPRARSAAATSTGSIPAAGEIRIVADDFVRPNGIAFSPDESLLYVVGHRRHPRQGRPAPHPRLQGRRTRATLSGGEVFADCTSGLLRRLPARRRRAASGRAPATASTATTRTAP